MRRADIVVGAHVRFEARHGEVVGTITEVDAQWVVVTSDLNPIYRYRIPMSYAMNPNSTLKLGGKRNVAR